MEKTKVFDFTAHTKEEGDAEFERRQSYWGLSRCVSFEDDPENCTSEGVHELRYHLNYYFGFAWSQHWREGISLLTKPVWWVKVYHGLSEPWCMYAGPMGGGVSRRIWQRVYRTMDALQFWRRIGF